MHVPKCAGSSVQDYFFGFVGAPRHGECIRFDTIFEDVGADVIANACKARYVGGHIGWDTFRQISNPDTFLFTVLRDPAERFFSSYAYFQKFPTHYKGYERVKHIKGMSFEEFCATDDIAVRSFTDNMYARQFSGCLRRYPDDADEISAMTKTAVAHLERFDYIGYQDNILDVLLDLSRQLGLPKPSRIPQKNVTNDLPSQSGPEPMLSYTREEIIQLAGARLQGDLEIYAAAQALCKRKESAQS